MIWTARQLEHALNIKLNQNINAARIQINSKDVESGDIFLILNERAAPFVQEALDKGAAIIISPFKIESIPTDYLIVVEDSLVALEKLAIYKRNNSAAKFIGITGSSGKTTTKEFIRTILAKTNKCFASRGNFNNKLGLLINLASMQDDTEVAVFELGMSAPGELNVLSQYLKPDICCINNTGSAHIEFFENMEAIADAKCEIFDFMSKTGIAILNSDLLYLGKALDKLHVLGIKNIITFGKFECDYIRYIYKRIDNNIEVTFVKDDVEVSINREFLPEYFVSNFVAALSIATIVNANFVKNVEVFKEVQLLDGRGKITKIHYNGFELNVIDDSYNANLDSMKAALSFLRHFSGNKIAILGDMKELGVHSLDFHKKLVQDIVDSEVQILVLVGETMNSIADLLPADIIVKKFSEIDLVLDNLHDIIKKNATILIKGSRSMNLEKVITVLNY